MRYYGNVTLGKLSSFSLGTEASVFCWWWRQSTWRGKSDITNSRMKLPAAYVLPRTSPQLLKFHADCDFQTISIRLFQCWSGTRIQRLAEQCRLYFPLSLPCPPTFANLPNLSPSPPLHHQVYLSSPFTCTTPILLLLQLSSSKSPPPYSPFIITF
jgi:hypothetical protein